MAYNKQVAKEHQNAVLNELKRCIGKPTPLNGAICHATGLKENIVSLSITALTQNGVLTRHQKNGERWFTFIDTGDSTAPGPMRKLTKQMEKYTEVEPAMKLPEGVWFDDVVVREVPLSVYHPLRGIVPPVRKEGL